MQWNPEIVGIAKYGNGRVQDEKMAWELG